MNYYSKNQAIKCNFQSIDLAITDARSNLLDSLRFASHDRAHGISIVFGGKVIAGTDGRILDTLAGSYDGLIIESFSVGVLPNYGNDSFLNALSDWISAGKLVCMATQVTHEGSDMEVYQVGKVIKEKFPILESYNMTLEASVTKMMWVLGQTQDLPECRRLFYKTINHDLLFLYYQDQGKPFIFRCSNRLDRDTSGLTVISKHLVSASIMADMTKKRLVHREYLAIVKGDLTPPTGTITAPLSRKEGSIIERTVDFDHGEEAITHYKLVKKENGHSLVSLQLETGRTHQIRIHMKYLGYPLIGDYLYNPDMEHITRQALHSYHMEFPHPITGQKMTFTAPLPSDMSAISHL